MSTFAAKLQYNMTIYRLFTLLLTVIITCRISAQDEVIEHQGNKYIIHVEQLNPDNEMTLLDVLHICPEFFSTDGKDITAYYLLSVDDDLTEFACLDAFQQGLIVNTQYDIVNR